MIRLFHYIKERPFLLLRNPSLATQAPCRLGGVIKGGMFITSETAGLWSVEKLLSAALNRSTPAWTESQTHSLSPRLLNFF